MAHHIPKRALERKRPLDPCSQHFGVNCRPRISAGPSRAPGAAFPARNLKLLQLLQKIRLHMAKAFPNSSSHVVTLELHVRARNPKFGRYYSIVDVVFWALKASVIHSCTKLGPNYCQHNLALCGTEKNSGLNKDNGRICYYSYTRYILTAILGLGQTRSSSTEYRRGLLKRRKWTM